MRRRTIRNCSYIALCALLGYSYFQTKYNADIQKEVSVVDYENYRQVVYIDDDGVLIPVTYTIEDCPTIQSEVYELFTLMKETDRLPQSLHSVMDSSTQLESVIMQDDILQLHFKNLKMEKELRFLEAFAFVFCQLEEVNGIEFYVNGSKIERLPEGNILLDEPVTNKLGINNFESGTSHLYQTKAVTVYYSKKIDNEEFYVPLSKRIDSNTSLEEQLKTVVSEISVSSTLDKASLFNGLEVLDGSYMEDGHLYVSLNDAALLDETTVNSDVYDLLLLSFSQMDGVEEVTILVNGEALETRGAVNVSNITYNILKI